MIKLLDCTLRDGGYVNKWNFGYDVINDILDNLLHTKVDIVEAGFIRKVDYDANKTVFPNLKTLDNLIKKINKKNTLLATMAEISNPIPLDDIENATETNCDVIRVIVWKTKHTDCGHEVDALQESFEYCKGIAQKGYKLCIQPNRTDQYTDEEFEKMLELFAQLNPYAIYIVDSWGTMYSNKVLHYMEISHRILSKDIAIGFHGHNNMMQAFSTAEKIIERNFDRDIILDASIDGIGRGAGNLNLELIAAYMNEELKTDYILDPIYEIYDKHIKKLRVEYGWGSSFPYILSSFNNANPNYAAYFANKITLKQMQNVYDNMENDDAILYSDKLAEKYIKKCLE